MVLIEESASNPPRSPFMKGGGIIRLGAIRGGSLTPLCKGGLGGFLPGSNTPLWGAYLKPHPSGVDSLQKGDQGKERN
jgi:hypothetical protein